MTTNEQSHAAYLFRRISTTGIKLTPEDRAFLVAALDRMNEAEKAGIIAAFIKIMIMEG